MYQIVVAGAGPVGLWAACELQRMGASVVVLERLVERPQAGAKASTIHPRTMEMLRMRGLDTQVLEKSVRIPKGHFAMLEESRLDFHGLDTPFPFVTGFPQSDLEELLERHALELGVEVRRGHAVLDVSQTYDAVTVTVSGPDGHYTTEAAYLIGADGAGSQVRKSMNVPFTGESTEMGSYLVDAYLDDPPAESQFIRHGPDGFVMMMPRPGKLHRFGGIDPRHAGERRDQPLTLDDVRESVRRVAGTDFGMRDAVYIGRYFNNVRMAERYRIGRVFLAGDAAHVHFPAGGVGLNTGMQDAFNLAWKLAAVLHGWMPDELLDSYFAERYPVGADVLELTAAQFYLASAFSPEGQALRRLFARLLASEAGLNLRLTEQITALSLRYPPADPGGHGLVGTRVPDLTFTNGQSFHLLARSARPVLLDLTGGTLDPVRAPFPLDSFAVRLENDTRPAWSRVSAALVRPDGYVWWATEEASDADFTNSLHL